MEVFAGNSASIILNVIVAGVHVDPDGNTVSGILSTHPSVSPTVERLGVGRYRLTFAPLSPELVAGTIARVTAGVTIAGIAATPFDVPISVLPSGTGADIIPDDPALTLADLANRPRVVAVGTERIEEHSLKDQIEFMKYQSAQAAKTETVLPIRRMRQVHGRP